MDNEVTISLLRKEARLNLRLADWWKANGFKGAPIKETYSEAYAYLAAIDILRISKGELK